MSLVLSSHVRAGMTMLMQIDNNVACSGADQASRGHGNQLGT